MNILGKKIKTISYLYGKETPKNENNNKNRV